MFRELAVILWKVKGELFGGAIVFAILMAAFVVMAIFAAFDGPWSVEGVKSVISDVKQYPPFIAISLSITLAVAVVGQMASVAKRFTAFKSDVSTIIRAEVNALSDRVQFFVKVSDVARPIDSSSMHEFSKIMFSGPKKTIFAIDWNSGETWLSDDMLGYLAAQANWRAMEHGREIYRIFVWDRLDPLSKKLIDIHSMLGFHAFILSKAAAEATVPAPFRRDVIFWDFDIGEGGYLDHSKTANIAPVVAQEVFNKKILSYPDPDDHHQQPMFGIESPLPHGASFESQDAPKIKGITLRSAVSYAKLFNVLRSCECHKGAQCQLNRSTDKMICIAGSIFSESNNLDSIKRLMDRNIWEKHDGVHAPDARRLQDIHTCLGEFCPTSGR